METNTSLVIGESFPKKKKRSLSGEKVALAICFIIVLYLVLPPLISMIWTSLNPDNASGINSLSLRAFEDIFNNSKLWQLIGNTFIFAIGSTLGGVIFGSLMAWLVARTDAPCKKLAYAVTFVGFAVPGMLKVIGWVLLMGKNNGLINNILKSLFGTDAVLNIQTMQGMIFVESLMWIPMVFMLLVGPMRSMDPSLEESAAISGASPRIVYFKITARLLLPSILSVLILMFIRSIQAFETPLFLGTPSGIQVITSYIYLDLHESFIRDYAKASAYGTMLIMFLVVVLYLYYKITQKGSRFQTVTGKGFRPRLIRLGKWRWLGGAYLIVLFIMMILPILFVFYASLLPTLASSGQSVWERLSFSNYKQLLNYSGILTSIYDSLIVGTATAILAVLIAAFASWILVRSKFGGKWLLDQLIGMPLVYPGVVLSLGVLLFYLYVPIPLYGTLGIIIVAYVAHFSPYAMRYVQPTLLQVHKDLEESARVCGANGSMVFRKILVPILMPSLIGAWVFIFFTSIRELSIASLLYTAHTPVVATQVLDMWTNGNLTVLSAFGTIIAIISIIVASAVFGYAGRFGVKA